jgi:amino acid transporter
MPENQHKFGTAPVFFTAISTILGAILFLRFGYSVGVVGLGGTLIIVLIGHAVTIPTAMALSEIATNIKVEGGGAYYISFIWFSYWFNHRPCPLLITSYKCGFLCHCFY